MAQFKFDLTNPVAALLPFALLLCVYVAIDPASYRMIVGERCHGCNDFGYFIAVVISVFPLVLGLRLGAIVGGRQILRGTIDSVPENVYHAHARLVLAVSLLVALFSIVFVVTSGRSIFDIVSFNELAALREETWGGGFVGYLSYIAFYGIYVAFEYASSSRTNSRFVSRRFISWSWTLVVLCVLLSVLMFVRIRLFEIVLLLLLAHFRTRDFAMSIPQLVKGCGLLIGAVFLFAWTMQLREASDEGLWDVLDRYFFGYFVAPFNKLSLILDGQFKLPEAPPLFYSFTALYSLPYPIKEFVNSVAGVGADFSRQGMWRFQFSQAYAAGFNSAFIWPTGFGSVFSELGWAAYIYFFAYGALVGVIYKRFRAHGAWATFFYPHMFSAVFWLFGDETLFAPGLLPALCLSGGSALYLSLHADRLSSTSRRRTFMAPLP